MARRRSREDTRLDLILARKALCAPPKSPQGGSHAGPPSQGPLAPALRGDKTSRDAPGSRLTHCHLGPSPAAEQNQVHWSS